MKYSTRISVAVVAAVAALAMVSPVAVTSAMAAESAAEFGCDDGAACVWHPGSGPTPFLKFWSYGPHNLNNVYGRQFWFNNQYGSPPPYAWLCSGYNGTGHILYKPLAPHTYSDNGAGGNDIDFTPVNSVVLGRPGEPPHCG